VVVALEETLALAVELVVAVKVEASAQETMGTLAQLILAVVAVAVAAILVPIEAGATVAQAS
jgi:hypothetical protein